MDGDGKLQISLLGTCTAPSDGRHLDLGVQGAAVAPRGAQALEDRAVAVLLVGGGEARLAELECLGLAGPKMEEAGCRLAADLTALAVMGFVRVLGMLPQFWRMLKLAERCFRDERPDAVVMIDADLRDAEHLHRVMTALEAESNVSSIARHRDPTGATAAMTRL